MKIPFLIICLIISQCLVSQTIQYKVKNGECSGDTCVLITIGNRTIFLIGDYVLEKPEKNSFSLKGHLYINEKDSNVIYYNNLYPTEHCRIFATVKPNLISFSFDYHLWMFNNTDIYLERYVTMDLYLDSLGVLQRNVDCHFDTEILNKKEAKSFSNSLNDKLFKSKIYSRNFYYSLFAGSMLGHKKAIYYFENLIKLAKKYNLSQEFGPEIGDYFLLLEIYRASVYKWNSWEYTRGLNN
jgi:hypothetical protein